MKRKYKLTGCAKIFLVIIILAPLAYLGAAYFNGENGIENVKDLFGIDQQKSDSDDGVKIIDEGDIKASNDDSSQSKRIEQLKKQVEDLKKEVRDLKQENLQLKNQLQNLNTE